MQIATIETASLGDRSYLVHDGEVAAVIDPQRDIDRVEELLADLGVQLHHVLETHVHNDYVTGGPELAAKHGATYHVSAGDGLAVEHEPAHDGDVVAVGTFSLRAVHTPGHTPTHLAWVANDGEADVAVFTGGSMLFGSVGRTDLIAATRTEELTRAQFRSVRRLAEQLDDDTTVRPTHGFGSFCSSGDTSGVDDSTIAREREQNQALTIDDEDEFVATLLAGLDAHPAYYAHMAPLNRAGPAPVDLSPVEQVDAGELRRRIERGEWVVDLRSRTAFAADHLGGTVNVELADPASTYLGWLLPWGTPVTLLAEDARQVAEMQRQLVRIGINRPAGSHTGELPDDAATSGYRVADFAALRDAVDDGADPWVLDARRDSEWADDGHLEGAHHIPLHQLEHRLHEVPADRDVWVHCASGYRASIAASLLDRAGRRPVLLDDAFPGNARDHFDLLHDDR